MIKNMEEIKGKWYNIIGKDGNIRIAGIGYLYGVNVFSGKSNEEMHLNEIRRHTREGESLVLIEEKSYGIVEAD